MLFLLEHLSLGPALLYFLFMGMGRKLWKYQDTQSHLKILSLIFTGYMTFVKFSILCKPEFSHLLGVGVGVGDDITLRE